MSFEYCDGIANDLFGLFTPDWPDLFWKVYLAFDAGECHRPGRSDDPVAELTVPLIAEIVRDLA